MLSPTVERTNPMVLTLRHDGTGEGYEQRYLLIGDAHWDNVSCDRKLLTRHLDVAKESDAGIIVVGDWFCAMQGKYDPRSNKDDVRPEHQHEPYLDCLVDTAAEYLQPYAANIVMLADGNHETSIRRRLETDLLERLAHLLSVPHMGYSGYIRAMFAQANNTGNRTRRTIYWHHGSGGGGPVTKGVIQTNRRAASVDADVYITGHIHESWLLENVVMQMTSSGRVIYVPTYHVQLPTYKQEMAAGGYHIEKGRPPKPLGGWWMVFHYDPNCPGKIGIRFERAN